MTDICLVLLSDTAERLLQDSRLKALLQAPHSHSIDSEAREPAWLLGLLGPVIEITVVFTVGGWTTLA